MFLCIKNSIAIFKLCIIVAFNHSMHLDFDYDSTIVLATTVVAKARIKISIDLNL